MAEVPYFVEVHHSDGVSSIYFASEAKFHLKEGRLAAEDPAKLAGDNGEFQSLAVLLKGLPKQKTRTSGHARFLRSHDFPLWPGMRHAEAHYLIEGGHYWRRKEMTEAQEDLLRKLGEGAFWSLTRGEACDLIEKSAEK